VVAPHPDDECIATSGVIRRALAARAKVHVVYLTYGDNHELAYWATHLVPALTPEQFRSLAETRHAEAVAGMTSLGLSSDSLTFLGYPDSGTLHIWFTTWQPGSGLLHEATGTRSVPYADALDPGALYNAASMLQDMETVIKAARPTVVFFPSPLDLNVDHQAAYLIMTAALHDLALNPVRYTYLVHEVRFPWPRGYYPTMSLDAPPFVAALPLHEWTSALSPAEVSEKHAATLLYRSQIEVSSALLESFSRRNELFIEDDSSPLTAALVPFILIPAEDAIERSGEERAPQSVSASRPDATTLRLLLSFATPPTEDAVAELSVFPMTPGHAFAQEPKLVITLRHGRESATVDLVTGRPVTRSVVGNDVGSDTTIDIQLPEAVAATQLMIHVRAGFQGLALYSSPWQVLGLSVH
jgi:LmbE family N-acetylglucosaminyl deacetylase